MSAMPHSNDTHARTRGGTDIVLHFTSKASETMRDRFLRRPKTIKRCLREKKFGPIWGVVAYYPLNAFGWGLKKK